MKIVTIGQETEAQVKKDIRKQLKDLHPDVWEFMPVQTGYGTTGVPDHIACVPVTITEEMVGHQIGMFVGIEAKRKSGKLSELQKQQLVSIHKAFGYVDVIRGRADVKRAFALLKQKRDRWNITPMS